MLKSISQDKSGKLKISYNTEESIVTVKKETIPKVVEDIRIDFVNRLMLYAFQGDESFSRVSFTLTKKENKNGTKLMVSLGYFKEGELIPKKIQLEEFEITRVADNDLSYIEDQVEEEGDHYDEKVKRLKQRNLLNTVLGKLDDAIVDNWNHIFNNPDNGQKDLFDEIPEVEFEESN